MKTPCFGCKYLGPEQLFGSTECHWYCTKQYGSKRWVAYNKYQAARLKECLDGNWYEAEEDETNENLRTVGRRASQGG